ncbi:MAG TPA: RDD family protein [Terriglobales bacterium]|jgi:uncharacterized RDD family membrane protein YckC|nr:RDD family protein [Terriglobales bacterium]
MRPRFEPEAEAGARALPAQVATDSDGSEPQFAANLEPRPETTLQVRFVVEREVESNNSPATPAERDNATGDELYRSVAALPPQDTLAPTPVQTDLIANPNEWRQEVAARVDHYRARRRPRGPRYPSLQLKFEPTEPAWTSTRSDQPLPPTRATRQAVAVESAPEPAPAELLSAEPISDVASETAKILEFPRSAIAPPRPVDELAEPVLDRPRILEVPEVEPPPPALGGILIEPAEPIAQEKRPGFEIPLQSAPMWRRMLAGGVDSVLVLSAFAGFAYIVLRLTAVVPPLRQAAGVSVLLAGLLWAAYQYLMLVYTGTTPGLMAARLRLSRFDGNLAARSLRRWRVLTSVLSGVSLGLGYAWCFLDEDGLCWHDRITRTYMAPRAKQSGNVG